MVSIFEQLAGNPNPNIAGSSAPISPFGQTTANRNIDPFGSTGTFGLGALGNFETIKKELEGFGINAGSSIREGFASGGSASIRKSLLPDSQFNMFNKEIDFQQDVINQFLQQKNPFFGTADSQFAGAAGAIGGIGGDLSGLAGQLQTSALASTAGASSAAAQQARVAAGGRGGLAFGGGAGQIASRAATNAAVGQSAALAQEVVPQSVSHYFLILSSICLTRRLIFNRM